MKTSAVKHFTKTVAATMSAVFSFTLIPMALGQNAVIAATAITKDQSNTELGVSGIKDPTSGGDANSEWAGCYVYFGNYNGPIKFRVLQVDSTAHTKSKALFLDSDSVLFDKRFDDDSNVWKDSELRNYLNGDFIDTENDYFTAAEVSAIALSTVDPHDLVVGTGAKEVAQWTKTVFGQYVALNEDYIFVLDAEEASNSDYGYSYTDESCASRKKTGGTLDYWWLRSADTGNGYYAGFVYYDGYLGISIVYNDKFGVAPALNINQESIIFNTAVENEANAYKLTLSDSNLKIAVPAGQYVTASGTTITVPYAISGDDAGTATRASILITKGEWDATDADIILYDELGASTASSGTFTLPSECDLSGWGTDYHVYILAENINDVKVTDYASEPVEIMPQTYTVTVQNDGNGTATADVTSGPEGTEVTLTATPSSGYLFKEWQVVSGGVTVTDNKFTIGTTDVTVKAVFEAKPADPVTVGEPAVEPVKSTGPFTYTVVSGGDSTWTEGDPDLVVKVKSDEDGDHSFERYEYTAIDGTKLTDEQAPATSGSTVITIKSDYLKKLSEGKHTILVNFTDASITTTITIVKKSSGAASVPATGEMIGVTAVAGTVLILSACSILIVMRTKKREDEL